ncbi:unnamed protein product, partial [Vitis vinifera]
MKEFLSDPQRFGQLKSGPFPTRGTHLLMTRGTHSHPDQPHPDFPKRTRGALLLPGLPQGEAQTLTNITSGRLPQRILTTDIHYPGMFVRIVD